MLENIIIILSAYLTSERVGYPVQHEKYILYFQAFVYYVYYIKILLFCYEKIERSRFYCVYHGNQLRVKLS